MGRLLFSLPEYVQPLVYHDGRQPTAVSQEGDYLVDLKRPAAGHYGSGDAESLSSRICTWIGAPEAREAERSLAFAMPLDFGGNRNKILLREAGSRFVSMDDDTVCEFFALPELTEVREASPISFGYTDKMDRLPRASKSVEKGRLLELYEVLGDIPSETSPFAAMAGILGARWFSRPHGVLHATPDLHQFSYGSRGRYNRMKRNPLSLMQPRRAHTGRSGYFVTTCCAIDARRMLPPFPPRLRPEDAFWGTLATALNPKSHIAYLPFMVYHDPLERHGFSDEDYRRVRPDPGLLALIVLRNLLGGLPGAGETAGYNNLGDRFIETSRMSEEEWVDYAQDLWLKFVAGSVRRARELSEERHNKPKWWAEDLGIYIDAAVSDAEASERHLLDTDLRAFLGEYGALLKLWPQIWSAAVAFNSEERTV